MKKEDLIVGKYYKLTESNGSIYIFKLKYLYGYNLYHENGYIVENIYKISSFKNPYIIYFTDSILEEVCLTEFIHLLPVNHPDKIIFRKQRINSLLS